MKPDELLHRAWLKSISKDLASSRILLKRLESLNLSSSAPVVAAGGPVVSLTTYGERINTVFLTIESIARGRLLPQRLILWLDDEDAVRQLPDSLRRLETRGLEVKLTSSYGPHTKYYPYLKSTDALGSPLVTADDDTLYPRSWLQRLDDGYRSFPTLVNCYRAHVVSLDKAAFAPYVTWGRCRSTTPSFLNFATGVSGVIYPPALQQQLKAAGREFLNVCPKADDIWLHVQALRGGFKVRQLKSWEQSFPVLPETQATGLVQGNVHDSQNDVQIRETYSASDVALLQAAAAGYVNQGI